jgi:hypothetical protein
VASAGAAHGTVPARGPRGRGRENNAALPS